MDAPPAGSAAPLQVSYRAAASLLRPATGGCLLSLRVVPRAKRTAIDGLARDAQGRTLLQVRLAAPPVDGAANAALIAFLAAALNLRKAAVTIAAGESARIKQVHLAADPEEIMGRLAGLIA
jgi:uncharacterized protein (TIGR00251 family)